MSAGIDAAALPGSRMGGYRNSSPRLIRLLGLGEEGSKVARKVAQRGRPNVEVRTNARPVGWEEIAEARPGAPTNMLVTFVLLQHGQRQPAAPDQRAANARGFSDLFVTTSDADYVSDLIDNLAS